jgi:hypothetical protein
MGKNLIEQGILSFGGLDGGIISDGSASTAVLTGLAAKWIEVNSATTFTALTVWDHKTATAVDILGTNVPTGVAVAEGARFGAGYGREFRTITHAGGQIGYYTAIPS